MLHLVAEAHSLFRRNPDSLWRKVCSRCHVNPASMWGISRRTLSPSKTMTARTRRTGVPESVGQALDGEVAELHGRTLSEDSIFQVGTAQLRTNLML